MEIEIIKGMIHNSTWIEPKKEPLMGFLRTINLPSTGKITFNTH
jgi:hypothetical protein